MGVTVDEKSVGRLRIRQLDKQLQVVVAARVNSRALRLTFLPSSVVVAALGGTLGLVQIASARGSQNQKQMPSLTA